MLALASTSAPALAKGPSVSVMVGTSTAYSNRDGVASSLLAGGMSRLAAISAQQGGITPLPWAPDDAIVNDRRVHDFQGKLPGWQLQGIQLRVEQPAFAYRQSELTPSFMRDLMAAPAAPLPQTNAFIMPAGPAPAWSGQVAPRMGQPDVFGSVAMPIARTALDGKWAAVSAPLPGKGAWDNILHAARGSAGEQQVQMVNHWVNHRLRFVDDRRGGDSWASAGQSLQRGAGDCEDYAIAKMKLLEAAGFDRRALFLVIARDLVRQADHAVLAVRIGGELMILDNMTDRVLPSSSVSDYRPIMSFNAYGRWTHGYRVKTPQTVQFAAR